MSASDIRSFVLNSETCLCVSTMCSANVLFLSIRCFTARSCSLDNFCSLFNQHFKFLMTRITCVTVHSIYCKSPEEFKLPEFSRTLKRVGNTIIKHFKQFLWKNLLRIYNHTILMMIVINKLEQNSIYYVFFIRGKICPNQENVLLFSATSSLESVA